MYISCILLWNFPEKAWDVCVERSVFETWPCRFSTWYLQKGYPAVLLILGCQWSENGSSSPGPALRLPGGSLVVGCLFLRCWPSATWTEVGRSSAFGTGCFSGQPKCFWNLLFFSSSWAQASQMSVFREFRFSPMYQIPLRPPGILLDMLQASSLLIPGIVLDGRHLPGRASQFPLALCFFFFFFFPPYSWV